MTARYFDQLEIRDPLAREQALFNMLPDLLRRAIELAPGWAAHLQGVDPAAVTDRAALAALPILRKSSLAERQARHPPFGGFATSDAGALARVFMSPGPIFEPEGQADDWWRSARALHAAGFGRGDLVLNTFSYHLTAGGWILDAGLRALGCAVIPAGVGNTEKQLDAITHLKPTAYVGVPDFLKMLLDRARETGRPAGSIRKALVSGGALTPPLRHEYRHRGVDVFQAYAIADAGVLAYESAARDGLIVEEGVIIEIVRPGTAQPVPAGEIGEVVVTSFNRDYPMIRLATGDLSAVQPGISRCGRTNMRIKGWLGRADIPVRIGDCVIQPALVGDIGRRHPELGRLRLVVDRNGNTESVTLLAEADPDRAVAPGLGAAVAASLRDVTRLVGEVQFVASGSLPNDGRVIADERGME